MKKIKNNLFKSLKTAVFSAIVGLSVSEAQGVFITEIADPNNASAGGRFVELHNNTGLMLTLQVGVFAGGQMQILIHKLM